MKLLQVFQEVYGDRLFAFESSASPKGFPYLTAREQPQTSAISSALSLSRQSVPPINLTEAESMGANPVWADPSELMVDVETPDEKHSRLMIRR